jgi:hypothetical protein
MTTGQPRARITDLNRQREQIQRDWLSQGTDVNPRYLQESVELIDAEITRLERQIDLSKRLRAAQRNPRSDDRGRSARLLRPASRPTLR